MDLLILKVVTRTTVDQNYGVPSHLSACYRQLTTKCVSENRQKT